MIVKMEIKQLYMIFLGDFSLHIINRPLFVIDCSKQVETLKDGFVRYLHML